MSSMYTLMYWLSTPPRIGLTARWAPCAPMPITPPPNSTSEWPLESPGHPQVPEVLPREEQERLALAVRQSFDRVGHAREEQAGIERPGASAPVRRLAGRRHPGARAQPPSLAAPVLH